MNNNYFVYDMDNDYNNKDENDNDDPPVQIHKHPKNKTSISSAYKHSQSKTKRNEPTSDYIKSCNSNNDTLTLDRNEYNPGQAMIEMTGFDDLTPFITQPKSSQKSLSSIHDNNFNDYNEEGYNDINGSDYRQRMIKQSIREMFEQTNSMFGNSEKVHSNQKMSDSSYDANGSFTPSHAQASYLQKQSRSLFDNIQ